MIESKKKERREKQNVTHASVWCKRLSLANVDSVKLNEVSIGRLQQ